MSESLYSWMEGMELHDLDYIIWPVHHLSPWMLCISKVAHRNIMLLETLHPGSPADERKLRD